MPSAPLFPTLFGLQMEVASAWLHPPHLPSASYPSDIWWRLVLRCTEAQTGLPASRVPVPRPHQCVERHVCGTQVFVLLCFTILNQELAL